MDYGNLSNSVLPPHWTDYLWTLPNCATKVRIGHAAPLPHQTKSRAHFRNILRKAMRILIDRGLDLVPAYVAARLSTKRASRLVGQFLLKRWVRAASSGKGRHQSRRIPKTTAKTRTTCETANPSQAHMPSHLAAPRNSPITATGQEVEPVAGQHPIGSEWPHHWLTHSLSHSVLPTVAVLIRPDSSQLTSAGPGAEGVHGCLASGSVGFTPMITDPALGSGRLAGRVTQVAIKAIKGVQRQLR